MGEIESTEVTPETEEELLNRLTDRILGVGFDRPLWIKCIADEVIRAGETVKWNEGKGGDGVMGHVRRCRGLEAFGWGMATRDVQVGEVFQVAVRRVRNGEGTDGY